MKKAMLIGAMACSGAVADEYHSTFGHDWVYSAPWTLIGQTMTVPETSNDLESFAFGASAWGDGTVPYIIAVYDWDDVNQRLTGEALFGDFGVLVPDGTFTHHHQIDTFLPEGETVVVVLGFFPDEGMDYSVAYTIDSAYDNGSFVATEGAPDEFWDFAESDEYDMLFAADWRACEVDMYDDDILNIFDYLAFQAAFQAGDMKADFSGDGVLNVLDFVEFQAAFLEGC